MCLLPVYHNFLEIASKQPMVTVWYPRTSLKSEQCVRMSPVSFEEPRCLLVSSLRAGSQNQKLENTTSDGEQVCAAHLSDNPTPQPKTLHHTLPFAHVPQQRPACCDGLVSGDLQAASSDLGAQGRVAGVYGSGRVKACSIS